MDRVEMVSLLDIIEFMDSNVFSRLLWVMWDSLDMLWMFWMGESLSENDMLTWSAGIDWIPKAAWGSAKGPPRCISLACGSCSMLMLYFVGSSLGLDLKVEVVLGKRT